MKAIKQYIAISISILLMLQSIIFMVISFLGGATFLAAICLILALFFIPFYIYKSRTTCLLLVLSELICALISWISPMFSLIIHTGNIHLLVTCLKVLPLLNMLLLIISVHCLGEFLKE